MLKIDLKLNERIFGLDVMRAIAIILVLLLNGDPLIRRNFPDFPRFWHLDGVDLFFVLSGFLIGTILIKTFEKNGFNTPTLTHFWKFRWFRTLPNYYLVLAITLAFVYLGKGVQTGFSWKYLFFLQNFSYPHPNFFSVAWSLAVEEWFYLSFPLVAMIFAKLIPGFTVKHVMLATIVFFILAPLMFRIQMVINAVPGGDYASLPDIFIFEKDIRNKVVTRLDTIAFGVLGSYLGYYHADIWKKYRIPAFVTGVILYFSFRAFKISEFSFFTYNLTLLSFSLFLFLPLASTIRSGPVRIAVPVTFISMISYSLYLLHRTLIVDLFRTYGGRPFTDAQAVIYYVLYFILAIVLSTLLFKYFEQPMLKLREKDFSFRKKTVPQPSGKG